MKRHTFRPDPARPIICVECGNTQGSVVHSYLGSTRHITRKGPKR